MSKHTPTPWKASGNSIINSEDTICIANIECDGGYEAQGEQRDANAKFILKACNSHEKLVAALNTCVGLLEISADDAEECGYDQRAENIRLEIKQARAELAEAEWRTK
jgi:hypothetical protein